MYPPLRVLRVPHVEDLDLLRSVLGRSRSSLTSLHLPSPFSEELFAYLASETLPALTKLTLTCVWYRPSPTAFVAKHASQLTSLDLTGGMTNYFETPDRSDALTALHFPRLRHLTLRDRILIPSGQLARLLSNAPQLTELSVDFSGILRVPPPLLTSLTSFSSDNELSEEGATLLDTLPRLRKLQPFHAPHIVSYMSYSDVALSRMTALTLALSEDVQYADLGLLLMRAYNVEELSLELGAYLLHNANTHAQTHTHTIITTSNRLIGSLGGGTHHTPSSDTSLTSLMASSSAV